MVSIVVATRTGDGQPLTSICIIMGAGITIFGSLGLFAIKRHPSDIRDTRLYLLILYVDFWAVALGIAGCIVSSIFLANCSERND